MRADGTHIGLSAFGLPAGEFVDLTVAAEISGFDSIWHAEHILLPADRVTSYPGNAATGALLTARPALTDPFVLLAAVAVVTSRIQLATGIYLAALRSPLVTARATITLHELSAGRFSLGVGAGWMREEFDAIGIPYDERGVRLDETADILRAAWSGRMTSHHGRHFDFTDVQMCVEPAAIPLIVGGHSRAALQRAARHGDGWFTSGTPSLSDTIELRNALLTLREVAGRTGTFAVYVRPEAGNRRVVEEYIAAGFDRIVFWAHEFWPAEGTIAEKSAALRSAAADLGLRAPSLDRTWSSASMS
jgi:probable F420-dependent oxidoreductase